MPILRGFNLEGVANRDSLSYLSQYSLPDNLPTILRGTLRYPGFSRQVDAFKKIGLLSTETLPSAISSWAELVDVCLASQGFKVTNPSTREEALATLLGSDEGALSREVLETLDE